MAFCYVPVVGTEKYYDDVVVATSRRSGERVE
jgi:hypothetical protein